MNENQIIQANGETVPLPAPRVPIAVRVATLADLPAIDALQKLHHKQLGFFPRAQMEGYLKNEWVIVAESVGSRQMAVGGEEGHSLPTAYSLPPTILGYCASRDRYQKRDELGAAFQLCVDPTAQRMFVGANLLQAVFERAPYGCRLFCCWCAQDLAANYFWEAMGFVPLAFRAGGKVRMKRRSGDPTDSSFIPHPSSFSARVHIFWQKRIREGDTVTPWWFPCQTSSGSIREDRLVLPIPPGFRWDDEMPVLLPREQQLPVTSGQLPEKTKTRRARSALATGNSEQATSSRIDLSASVPSFAPKTPAEPAKEPKKRVKATVKNDPKLIAAARELRDRWLERVNSGQHMLTAFGKYDLRRLLPARDTVSEPIDSTHLIAA